MPALTVELTDAVRIPSPVLAWALCVLVALASFLLVTGVRHAQVDAERQACGTSP